VTSTSRAARRRGWGRALIYLTDRTDTELHLAGAAGADPGSAVAPWRLSLREASAWVGSVLRERELVVVEPEQKPGKAGPRPAPACD
jgi:hypothetical protein